MKEYYCFRCEKVMPFLEEEEWRQIEPLIKKEIRAIKEYREEHNCDLGAALKNYQREATAKFEELTGIPGVSFSTIQHLRLQDSGPECPECGFLLRTPKAKYCVHCGWVRDGLF